jgi:hypothetical protein
MGAALKTIHPDDWVGVRNNFARIKSVLYGPDATPTFAGATLSGLTSNSLLYPISGVLTSLGVATDGQLPVGSTGAAPVLATLTATANRVAVTNASGSITLSTPQDIHSAASNFTVAGATVTGASVVGLNSAIFKPAAGGDSTTFMQVKDAAGASVMTIDTVGGAGNTSVMVGVQDSTEVLLGRKLTSGHSGVSMHKPLGANKVTIYCANIGQIFHTLEITSGDFVLMPNSVEKFRLKKSTGFAGFSETAPETLLELTHATPTITGHCDTHSDLLDARAVTYQAFGEQSGGEETTLGKWTFAHDSALDDEKAYWKLVINTGSDGDSPTEALEIGSDLLATFAGDVSTVGLSTLAGRILNVTRYTTTQTLGANDHHVAGDTDGGAFTITLLAGVAGTEHRIANTGTSGNNLIIAPDGAELLIGVNSNFTLLDGEALHVVYEATEGWF